jgi:hypothetical protein
MPPQLSRLIVIFGVLVLAFITVRVVLKPATFSQYGHYRGAALTEALAREPAYIPRAECAQCHDEQAAQNAAGPHSRISCQTCHGPGREHIADPSLGNIHKPAVRDLCLRCHDQRDARPHQQPQIDEKEHADGANCGACHTIHNPAEVK